MRLPFVAAAIAFASAGAMAHAKLPPLRDPVFLNIGFVCQWKDSCMDRQKRAMKKALSFVKKSDPPNWKVQLCNRRAVQTLVELAAQVEVAVRPRRHAGEVDGKVRRDESRHAGRDRRVHQLRLPLDDHVVQSG